MKVMISQPMNGKTDVEIKTAKKKAVEALKDMGYQFVNTFFENERTRPERMTERGVKNVPLCFLAMSLDAMSRCDAVYFCKGWENARGCCIEHEAARAYGLRIIYEEV